MKWGRPGAVWGILAFDQMLGRLGRLGFRGVVFPISIIHCGILEVSVDKYFIQWNCLPRSMVKWIQKHQMDFDYIHITLHNQEWCQVHRLERMEGNQAWQWPSQSVLIFNDSTDCIVVDPSFALVIGAFSLTHVPDSQWPSSLSWHKQNNTKLFISGPCPAV